VLLFGYYSYFPVGSSVLEITCVIRIWKVTTFISVWTLTLLNDITSPDFPSILNTVNYFPCSTSHFTIYIITRDGLSVFEMD